MKTVARRMVFWGGLAVFAIGAAALAWRYRDALGPEPFEALVERFVGMGPWVFFSLMATLPLLWAPLSPFLLLAPAFGTPAAIVGSIVALAVNMSLAWLLSGRLFRPFFERLARRFGYAPPRLTPGGMASAVILLRLTPGVPFPLQNYLLGLSGIPFGRYLAISLPIMCVVSTSMILFGEAVMRGNLGLAMLAIAVAVAVAVGVRYAMGRMRARALTRREENDGLE